MSLTNGEEELEEEEEEQEEEEEEEEKKKVVKKKKANRVDRGWERKWERHHMIFFINLF